MNKAFYDLKEKAEDIYDKVEDRIEKGKKAISETGGKISNQILDKTEENSKLQYEQAEQEYQNKLITYDQWEAAYKANPATASNDYQIIVDSNGKPNYEATKERYYNIARDELNRRENAISFFEQSKKRIASSFAKLTGYEEYISDVKITSDVDNDILPRLKEILQLFDNDVIRITQDTKYQISLANALNNWCGTSQEKGVQMAELMIAYEDNIRYLFESLQQHFIQLSDDASTFHRNSINVKKLDNIIP